MIVVIYIISVVVFCFAARILPILLLLPLGWLYRTITKKLPIAPIDPVFWMPYAVCSVLLLYVTRYVWVQWGYEMGWLFATIIVVIHLLLGNQKGANSANQASSFAIVIGVVLYGLSRLIF